MRRFLFWTSRYVASSGLFVLGLLHVVWAAGSSWPAKDRKELALAVVGSKRVPDARATLVVAGGAFAGSKLVWGVVGESGFVVFLRRLLGLGLLARAALGGEVAAAAIGLPAPGKRFTALDRQVYRPLCAVLGLAVLLGSGRRRPRPTEAT